jgi:hypothetical protein
MDDVYSVDADKHGQLGIWDARAPTEDGDESADKEGGKIYRLQPHWPATSKSSICSLKLDPLDSHGVSSSLLSRQRLC